MTLLSLSKPRHADQAAVCEVCAEQATHSHAASEYLGLKSIHDVYQVLHIEMKQLFTCELVEDL